jgi:tetratricopeptide (TPR) repeat protein
MSEPQPQRIEDKTGTWTVSGPAKPGVDPGDATLDQAQVDGNAVGKTGHWVLSDGAKPKVDPNSATVDETHEDGRVEDKTGAWSLSGQSDPGAATVDETHDEGPVEDKTGAWSLSGQSDPGGATVDQTHEEGQPTGRPSRRKTGGGADDAGFSLSAEARGERKMVASYEILGELGRGGMGVVYKARQAGLNRLVALKVVLAGAHVGEVQLARFYAEAEAVAGLQHANIVQIYEVGTHDDLPYFSLEYVDGGSLAQKLDRKPQPPKEAARILAAIVRGMVCAHDHGIIHRDLKPANVLLTKDGVPKIADFGLAKRLESDSSQTKSGTLMGTPSYMAPEQAAGKTKEVGPLSDLYALGAILYEMLTGRPPLVGTTVIETLDLVQKKEPLPPSKLQPGVPRDLETICLKCLQKEPDKRYASAHALAEDLAHFLAGEPIRARPVSGAERLWRWCKRNPRVATLTGIAAALLLTAGIALTALVVTNARQEADEARRRDQEHQAVEETRQLAQQRLDQATETIKTGDHKRTLEQLRWSTPLFDNAPDLQDVRTAWRDLRSQVEVFSEFKHGLDGTRFALYAGSPRQKEQAQQECRHLIDLDEQIRARKGRGSAGLPPLNADQLELFREDEFETLLIAAMLETDMASGADEAAKKAAARRAIDLFDRADRVLPGMRVVYAKRCECWGTLGDKEKDEADKAKAQAIKPTSVIDHFWHGFADHVRAAKARGNNDPKGAQELYRKEIAEYAAVLQLRPDHFWAYFNWANCMFELNSYHDALVGYCACIRVRPDFPWPYNNRGSVHLRLGEPEQALQDYDAALALDSDYAEARTNRGMAYFRLNKPGEALADLDRAIQLSPDYAQAYDYRGEVRRAQKQYAPALEDYTRLLALTSDKGPVYLKMAEVHHDLGRDEDAINDCTQALAINQNDAKAAYKRAGLYIACKEYAKACDDCSTVLKIFPTAIEPRRDRAKLLWRYLKDFDASLVDWKDLARRFPKDAEAQWSIGIIQMGRRQYGAAVPALQKAVDLKPDYFDAVWALAQIRLWQGDPKEALNFINPLAEKLPPKAADTLNIRGDIYRGAGEGRELGPAGPGRGQHPGGEGGG